MHPNAQLIERFYRAFQQLDGATMAVCYHPEAVFSDAVFQHLRGAEVGAMWRMLTKNAKQFTLEFRDVQADDHTGSAFWHARYLFSQTGNMTDNRIHASFRFRDGLIIEHRDNFNLWRWSRTVLGMKGVVLGWLPPVQAAIRKQARASLDKFMANL